MFTPSKLPEAEEQFVKAKEDFLKEKKPDYLNFKGVIEAEVNGNLEKFEPKLAEAIKARIEEAKKKGVYEPIKNIVTSEKLLEAQREKQYEQYMRLMGEVEARNVARRSSMDWMERNYQSPMSTESRPRQVQINPSETLSYKDNPANTDAMALGMSIEHAAIQMKDGTVFKGNNHYEAMQYLLDKFPNFKDWTKIKDGFTTNSGKFVERAEALQISDKAKQIPDDIYIPSRRSGRLMSEDLMHLREQRIKSYEPHKTD